MTDGNATLPVTDGANYAHDNGIVCISVGIGPNVNYTQLL